jgi:hypothetical protein
MDELTLTFNSPLTEEDWDVITDVDFDCTNNIWFHTTHGKDVEFVKVVRCGECKYMMPDGRCYEFADPCVRPSASDFCSYGERREDGGT